MDPQDPDPQHCRAGTYLLWNLVRVIEGSGSGSLTNGSVRPKNKWILGIRIRNIPQSCISSGISCGLSMPGMETCTFRFSSWAARRAASLSSRYRSLSSSPENHALSSRVVVARWPKYRPNNSKGKLFINNYLGSIWKSTFSRHGQCCGSGIRAFLTPGSGIRDPGSGIGFSGSRIPNPYFWELRDNFLGKKFCDSLKIGPKFFSSTFQK